ncbi:MAG: pyridoxamine 5'-phosphate oxidase [Actinomycetota bacterium]
MSEAPDEPLLERDLDRDPIAQVARWVDDARAAGVLEPTAMTLATVDAEGRPTARTVLLRGLDARGFRFYTNHGSRKARAIDGDGRVALVLLWKELGRQVKVTGRAEHLSREDSAAYFASRPRGHRLAAWASRQSESAGSREELDAAFAAMEERFAGVEDVPLPDHWGGFLVVPDTVEVWKDRRNRMHDRFRYTRESAGWRLERIWP